MRAALGSKCESTPCGRCLGWDSTSTSTLWKRRQVSLTEQVLSLIKTLCPWVGPGLTRRRWHVPPAALLAAAF